MKQFPDYDLGVARTGSEQLGLTVLITERFGRMTIANRTFALLVMDRLLLIKAPRRA